MNSNQLTPQKIEECEAFFKAIKTNGIAESKNAANTVIKNEPELLGHTVVNSVTLTEKDKAEICAALMNDGTFGFVNMAFKPWDYQEFKSLLAMRKHISNQLMSSCIFILDSKKVTTNEENACPFRFNNTGLMAGVYANLLVKAIPSDAILAILVPEALADIAEKVFAKNKIIPVQCKKGNLVLSAFTLASVAYCEDIKSDGRVGEMLLPNYHAALEKFLQANPKLTQFSMHCARIFTKTETVLSCQQEREAVMKTAMRQLPLILGVAPYPYRASCNFFPSLSLFNTPPSTAVSPPAVLISPIKNVNQTVSPTAAS